VSLEEITELTRIRGSHLRAIEEDRYDLLPPSLYVKGFLVAYARYLGLDPNEVVLRYQTYLRDTGIPEQKQMELPKPILSPRKKIKVWLPFVLSLAIILFIVFFIYYIPH